MLKQSYEVEILINGKPAKEYAHEGSVYIEGREGTRFSIRIRNNSYSKKLFVPTIDGLSVMNGEEGSFKSSGYIVQGNSSITIDGWRTSDKDVAEFYFSSPEKSYRVKMERGNNLGVIGVAVFSEDIPYFCSTYTTNNSTSNIFPCNDNGIDWNKPIYPLLGGTLDGKYGKTSLSCQNLNVSSNSGMSKEMSEIKYQKQQLGTGWGDQKRSEVTSVDFNRKSVPDVIFELLYNTREELERAGISFKKAPIYVYVEPQAFPGQYCKPPKN
jgi:hypothetical protein